MLLERELTPEDIPNELRLSPHAQLSHEIRPVQFHRSDTNGQPDGDLRAPPAFGHLLEHLTLPRRQSRVLIR